MLKRGFDIIVSFLGLVVLSPILLVITLMIKMWMPGPVFFKQERTGRYGNPFVMYKFRTMIISHNGNSISVKGENRITKLGAKLRKHKLDELPELLNVLMGDMSLVGPRPDIPEYSEKLSGEEKLILELRPGLTGPASLKYANEEEILASVEDPYEYYDEVIWPEKVRKNLEYYYNRSFTQDIMLIIKTFVRIGRLDHYLLMNFFAATILLSEVIVRI